jgi:tetratricopeptide (TPR) repeat protein
MKPGTIYKFVQELRRRRVFRGIVVYGASTLILLEAAGNIANTFGKDAAPPWFVWLLGIGFIGSLWFSWIYDITPGGIKKTEPAKDHPVPIPKKEIRIYQTTTFVCLMIIIGMLTYNIIDGANNKKIKKLEKSIAVIPVHADDLSYDESQSFSFVGEQITSCLLKVKDCSVRPWEDCRHYKRGDKPYPEIGMDLSAALLVDLSPYETQSQKNLFVNLIVASDGSLLMSESFKIDGSWSEEICEHSREISKRIARRLRIYLTQEERASIDERKVSARATLLASMGTNMTQDVLNNLQMGEGDTGNEKSEYIDSISFERAINYFSEAIKEEPTFAEAYANRAKAKLWGITAGFYNRSELEDCRKDIEKAFELDDNLPEAHVAMGFYHYFGKAEYDWALKSFEKAIEQKPDNNEYLFYLSRIHSSLGNWEKVQIQTDKVFESNPRNVLFLTNLGITYIYLEDFNRAIECQDRAIELNPQWFAPYLNKAFTLVAFGKTSEARSVVREVQDITGRDYFRYLAELEFCEGDFASAVENIEQAEQKEFFEYGESEGDAHLLKAKIYRHARKPRIAKAYYELAEKYYSNLIQFNTQNYAAYSKLGIAYAGLGKDQLALENGQKGMELGKEKYSATRFPDIMYNMAQTYVLIGDHESALSTLKELLNTHSLFTSEYIKVDPDMKELLDDPGVELSSL